MKILIINKFLHLNGGSETYIGKLGEHLLSKGHQVQYFGMEHENRVFSNSAESYTQNMDFHSVSALKKLAYSLKTVYSAEAAKKLRVVLDDFCPDVCHLNNFNFQLTPSIILEIKKWSKKTHHPCKIVYTAHDYQLVCPNHMCLDLNTEKVCEKCLDGSYINCVKNKCIHGSTAKSAVGALESYLWHGCGVYKHIDKIICCSEFIKTKLDRDPVLAQRTVVMHNFIDAAESVKAEKKDYVLYFGRFSREKGVDTLVKVAKQLPQIRFVFAGTGPLEEMLSGVKNIQNVGFKSGEELVKLISEARFTVYPSEWYENCPYSVMESQMYLTPVIGANIGGIPELIQNGATGELFESGNAEELKAKIELLWNDKALAERYCENCRNVKFYTAESYCKELTEKYYA